MPQFVVGAKRSIPTLDGWRAVAILLVMSSHAAMGFYVSEAEYYAQSPFVVGAFGVDVFFGLSGLLITLMLLEEWRESSIGLKAFYVRRAFRIFPPAMAFIAVAGSFGLIVSWPELLGCLFFFRNYVPNEIASESTQHLWSLSVEEHFYLVWPPLLAYAGVKRARSAAFVLCLACGIWRMLLISGVVPDPISGVPAHFRTDRRFDALLWGALIAFLVHLPEERAKLQKQLRSWRLLLPMAAAALCVSYYSLISSMVLAIVIPAILAGTALNPTTLLGRILDWPFLRWTGRISYSLYLWQQVLLTPGWTSRHLMQTWPFNIVAVVACAVASYYLLERPMIAWGRRITARKRVGDTALVETLAGQAAVAQRL